MRFLLLPLALLAAAVALREADVDQWAVREDGGPRADERVWSEP